MEKTSGLIDLVQRMVRIGVLPDDSDEDQLRKSTLVGGTVLVTMLAPVWVTIYSAHGLWLSALIPFAYQVFAVISLFRLYRTKRFEPFYQLQFLAMLLLPMFLQWSLGGFVASSGVVLWSFVTPVAALLCIGPRRSVPWFLAFIAVVILSAAIDPLLARSPADLPSSIRYAFFAVNFIAVTTTSFVIMRYFVRGREAARAELDEKHQELLAEQDRSERLLLNVLPQPIADRLKAGESPIADRVPDVSVVFADIVGFTSVAGRMAPADLVSMLNHIFSSLDRLVEERGLEKIKTIGDSYMLVGGLTRPEPDHLERAADLALAIPGVVEECTRQFDESFSLRIGIDAGPVVAGVIGQQRFSYDLWGDTVNTASRMATFGIPGQIQVTESVRRRLEPRYDLQSRGPVEIKGKGKMEVFLLLGRRFEQDQPLPVSQMQAPERSRQSID